VLNHKLFFFKLIIKINNFYNLNLRKKEISINLSNAEDNIAINTLNIKRTHIPTKNPNLDLINMLYLYDNNN
jgi:hypothetical protein